MADVTLDALAHAMGWDAEAKGDWSAVGKVVSVAQDGTLSVSLGRSAAQAADYCGASPGDEVFVSVSGGRARALAVKGGTGMRAGALCLVTATSSQVSSGTYSATVTAQLPDGYTFICWVQPRTNGWVGSPYVGSWGTDGQTATATLWWTVGGSGTVSADALCMATRPSADEYEGPYTVRPRASEQVVLPTAGNTMRNDVTVQEVPYYETSNLADGKTAIIAEVEESNG